MAVILSPRHELFKIDGGRKIMGLASGKAKLKLIDIESRWERNFTRPRGKLSPTSAPLNSQCQNRLASDDAETSATDGATEIGLTLHEARERSGQSLQDASHDLRIRLEYLRAIENGDFRSLPGMTYAIGYVRSYAQYLGLDVERAISIFKAEARELNKPRQLVFPSPAPEGKVPGGALMFIAAFLAIVGYSGWYYVTDSGRAVAGYTLAVPDVLQSWLNEKTDSRTSGDGFTSTAVAANQESALGTSLDATGDSSERIGTLDTATINAYSIAGASTPMPPDQGEI
ncbi:MAG: helix-turn-helix domain-containing protein, partial [Alphaproteobacteria bacterium]|nr:helix-turn-helix domain-containing protein [Alphaproteobacteria bacterium]